MPAPSHPRAAVPPLRLRELLLVALLLTGLLVGALAARGFSPQRQMLGGGFGQIDWELVDINVHYWNMWEFSRVFSGRSSPIHTTSQFFPAGLSTLTVHGDLLLKVQGGLLGLFFSPAWTFLLINLLALLGNGVGGYLLARVAGAGPLPALGAGVMLCFAGAAAWSVNTGNPESGTWLWFCLYLAGLLRLLRTGRGVALTALAGLATTLGNFVFFYPMILASALLLLLHLRGMDRARARGIGLTVALAALLHAPLAGAFLWQKAEHNLVRSADDQAMALDVPRSNSTPLLTLAPSTRTPKAEDRLIPLFAWALLLAALVRSPRRAAPWLALTGVFVLLCLGPTLTLHRFDEEGLLPLPYAALHRWVPLFSHIRFPHRLIAFALVGLAVAGALGAERLLPRPGRVRGVVLALLCFWAVAESLVRWPIRTSDTVAVNPFYQTLQGKPQKGAIITFPLDFGILDARYLYYQTVHGRPLFNGCLPRYFHEDAIPSFALLRSNILLQSLYHLQEPYLRGNVDTIPAGHPGDVDTLSDDELRRAVAELARLGFGHIVVHSEVTWEPGTALVLPRDHRLNALLRRALGDPVHHDTELTAFEITQ